MRAELQHGAKESDVTKVVLQLKWRHQFQFAGYYAASAKGFYAEEGLEVEILEGTPETSPLEEIYEGKSDFCIAASEAIVSRMKGRPVVACAVIFQHSPYVLITDKRSGIRTPADLIGRRVAISKAGGLVQFHAMMKNENLAMDDVEIIRGAWETDALIRGTADAISGYTTTQVPQFRSLGIDPHVIEPRNYGIDFYGDTLCSTKKFVKENPETTEAMVRASIKGWQYAMDHPEEIIDLIMSLPGMEGRKKKRSLFEQEAELTRQMVVPDIVRIGQMNPERWAKIASVYADADVVQIPENADWMEGFLFQPKNKLISINLKLAGSIVGAVGLLALFVCVWNAILQRRVEEATGVIREKSKLNQLLLDTAMDAVVGIDCDTNIVSWSGQAEKIFQTGKRNAVGKPIDFFLPDFKTRIENEEGRICRLRFEITGQRESGEGFPAELSVSSVPDGYDVWLNVFIRDVAEQRTLEEKLLQSQKMQAIGQLAGGIAHDFNNLLTVIQGNMELMSPNQKTEEKELSEEIRIAAKRASELTRQLLAFSRQQPMMAKPILIDECITSFGKILKRLIGEDIELVLDLQAEEATVDADPAMLEQVILNLAVNSRDAMPGGGTLTVETSLEERVGEVSDNCVKICVIDTGVGIESDRLPQIFEPFYTTKEVGEGTGLGLATAFGIVEQHGGSMEVISKSGEGCVFTILLPLGKGASKLFDANVNRHPNLDSISGGKETILLVEDEEMVRAVARKTLSRNGYQIIEAKNGVEALGLWEERCDEIDMLLTDEVMPGGIAGHDLVTRLKRERSDLPVLCVSGYSEEVFRGEVKLSDGALFLAKPYAPLDLLTMVREAIDEVVLAG